MGTKSTRAKAEWGGVLLSALLLLAGLLLVFRKDLFSGADLFFQIYRDPNPIFGFYPWSRFSLLCWEQGMFPLWSPYTLLGTPFLAHYQTSVFSVLSYPLLIGPFEKTVVPYLLARLLIAGTGAYFLCRRWNVTRSGSIIAALSFGLTGYLVQYVNDIHVVIDMLLPYLLLCGDRLVYERKLSDFLFTIVATVLVLLGGQPSAAFFTLALGYGYMVFMIPFSKRKAGGILLAGGALFISVILSLPQILPFLEYLPHAWTFHGPGFGKAGLAAPGTLTWIAPGFMGTLADSTKVMPHIRIAPYIGAVPVVFALNALVKPRNARTVFLSIVVLLCAGIMAGVPPISWIASIPGPDRLTFIKYLQPLLALAVALLAAHGFDRAAEGKIGGLLVAVFITALVTCMAWLFMKTSYPEFSFYMRGSFLTVFSFAAVLAICFLIHSRRLRNHPLKRYGSYAAFCAISLLWIELVMASSVNRPHIFRDLAEHNFDKYKQITKQEPLARVSVRPEVFFANAGLVPPIFDMGISDVVFVKESKELFTAAAGFGPQKFQREFMRYHSFELPYPPGRRGISRMLGARYWLSRFALPENRSIDNILKEARITAVSEKHYGRGAATLSKDLRKSIFAHPPCRMSFSNTGGVDDVALFTSLAGVDPEVNKRNGDGVWFSAISTTSENRLNFARYLDPRKKKCAQHWKRFSIKGREVERIILVTLPHGSDLHDWAYWGDPRFSEQAATPDRLFQGIKVYEDPKAWPRAFFAEKVIKVNSEDEVVPSLDREGYEKRTVVLLADEYEEAVIEPPSPAMVRLQSYGLQRVRYRAYAKRTSLLVLADAYYPGWRVFVSGREQKILQVNLGLRGVVVPPGESKIEFIYRPVSFRTGLFAALVSLAGLVFFSSMFRGRKKERAV